MLLEQQKNHIKINSERLQIKLRINKEKKLSELFEKNRGLLNNKIYKKEEKDMQNLLYNKIHKIKFTKDPEVLEMQKENENFSVGYKIYKKKSKDKEKSNLFKELFNLYKSKNFKVINYNKKSELFKPNPLIESNSKKITYEIMNNLNHFKTRSKTIRKNKKILNYLQKLNYYTKRSQEDSENDNNNYINNTSSPSSIKFKRKSINFLEDEGDNVKNLKKDIIKIKNLILNEGQLNYILEGNKRKLLNNAKLQKLVSYKSGKIKNNIKINVTDNSIVDTSNLQPLQTPKTEKKNKIDRRFSFFNLNNSNMYFKNQLTPKNILKCNLYHKDNNNIKNETINSNISMNSSLMNKTIKKISNSKFLLIDNNEDYYNQCEKENNIISNKINKNNLLSEYKNKGGYVSKLYKKMNKKNNILNSESYIKEYLTDIKDCDKDQSKEIIDHLKTESLFDCIKKVNKVIDKKDIKIQIESLYTNNNKIRRCLPFLTQLNREDLIIKKIDKKLVNVLSEFS